MLNDRIATVRPVEENKATGKVAAIYADIKRIKNIDFVPALGARSRLIQHSSK